MDQPMDIGMQAASKHTFINGDHVSIPTHMLSAQKSSGIRSDAFAAPAQITSSLFHNDLRPLKMIVETPGDFGSLCFVDDDNVKAPLKADEVEIKALAHAMDEVDFDILLGNRSNTTCIGKFAGVITAVGSDLEHSFQIGDRVCGWNTEIALGSQIRAKGPYVQIIPESWSFEMGSALSLDLSIAYYGLNNCAQAEPGRKMLVHGAGGSLGQAVILVADALGVQVIATVSTEAEKQVLLSCGGIEPGNILYSSDVALRQTLMEWTRGVGVDVVLNTTSTALPETLIKSITPFGTVVDMYELKPLSITADRAINYVSFDAAQLLQHRPALASAAFQTVLNLLSGKRSGNFRPITTISIADVASVLEGVKGRAHTGKLVLLAEEGTTVRVKETSHLTPALAGIERLIHFVTALDIPQDPKNALLALIAESSTAGTGMSSATTMSAALTPAITPAPSSVYGCETSAERRLASASTMSEARQVIFEAQLQKLASLVALGVDEVGHREPLMSLGLDSMTVVEFRDWLRGEFAADIDTSDVIDAPGIEALADLVAQKSKFVPNGLPGQSVNALPKGVQKNVENGAFVPNGITNGSTAANRVGKRESHFVPNKLQKFTLPDIDALCNAFLTAVKAFATPEEFTNTIHAVDEFKRPGSAGRALYNRAAARAADPNVENWEFELQLRRGFLDRRASLAPYSSFWFGHPLSRRQHSQAERAALLAYTANNFRLKLEAGLVKPVVLNGQELTTAYYPWIFSAARIPGIGSDEMQRYPSNDYCVVFWKGHAFQVNLCVEERPATQQELFAAFELILKQSMKRSFVTIFTSDNRQSWAETRPQLQRFDPQNAASIETIEAAAFTMSFDEATPTTAVERGRQFHFGGEKDAANRWHDKSLQFVICSNGASGTLGEHSMLDALTMSELNEAIATAISNHEPADIHGNVPAITPVPLPLKTGATLNAHIDKVRTQYAHAVQGAEHAYYLFEGYGSKSLRAQKLAPKSVFQMIIQLAAQSLFGQAVPCFETVNQAHYHLGRVDIIQVVNPQVAAFLAAARDPSVDMGEHRALLGNATLAHAACINKSRRNMGWERNFTALRALLEKDEPVPVLYEDPVYKRVRPRLLMSSCFETGMMEKGCLLKDPESVWVHYEVYEESVYFSVVTREGGRATRFCEHVKEAAELVRQIVLTEP